MSAAAQESYAALNKKTLAFFGAAARTYDAEYIVKVDDDAFVRLDRLSHAIQQWRQLGAGTRPFDDRDCCRFCRTVSRAFALALPLSLSSGCFA